MVSEKEVKLGTATSGRGLQMMMMMGLGRPKIRNDGSLPGPRSSSRATPLLLFIYCLSFFLQYNYTRAMIIIALLRHPSPFNTTIGRSWSPLPAIECLTIEGPFLPPLFLLHAYHLIISFLLFLLYPFSFWPGSPLAFAMHLLNVVAGLLQAAVLKEIHVAALVVLG